MVTPTGSARETDQAAVSSGWTDESERGESEGATEKKKRNGGEEEERGGRGYKVKEGEGPRSTSMNTRNYS